MSTLHETRLAKPLRVVVQVLAFAALLLPIAWLTTTPRYQPPASQAATIKLSLRHSGKLVGQCRQLSAEEPAQLPANMRAPQVCPRERSPVRVQLQVNGNLALDVSLQAKGLHKDGMAAFYRRITVPSGHVAIEVRMSDDASSQEFAYRTVYTDEVSPGRVLAIDFDARKGQFVVM
jgi:hypothetical protein